MLFGYRPEYVLHLILNVMTELDSDDGETLRAFEISRKYRKKTIPYVAKHLDRERKRINAEKSRTGDWFCGQLIVRRNA
jgi:hypothetical protein